MTQHNDDQVAVSFQETKSTEQMTGHAPPSGSSHTSTKDDTATKDDTPINDDFENEKAVKQMEEADAAAKVTPVLFANSGDAVWVTDDKELVGGGGSGSGGTGGGTGGGGVSFLHTLLESPLFPLYFIVFVDFSLIN